MLPLEQAQRRVLASVNRLSETQLPVWEARGLALARPVTAPHDVPPFTNSAMDGYAVRAGDVSRPPTVLEVIEDVPAGSVAGRPVTPGTTIKIMTGAPMPEGADAVARVEDTQSLPGAVRILAAPAPGTAVRPAGGDLAAGDPVFGAGVRLDHRHLAVLASLGVSPTVIRRPRAAVMSTGDELRPPDEPTLAPGLIRDTNRPLLIGALAELGAEVIDLGIVGDDPDRLRETLTGAAEEADMVLTSGGVSMGEYDLVKAILGDLGGIDFWQVAMQPAKPFAFGRIGGVPLLGLPGNPVSVMTAYEQFARPALLTMMGAEAVFRPRIPATAAEAWNTDPAKVVFTRVTAQWREGTLYARRSGGQMSNVLSALARADAWAVIPAGTGRVEEGAAITLELFSSPETRSAEEVLG